MKLSKTERRILACGRSRKGAWIEMSIPPLISWPIFVAPVRERGLKYTFAIAAGARISRSRKGAWIEIPIILAILLISYVAPVRERGLKYYPEDFVLVEICRSRKGAWIEILPDKARVTIA